MTGRTAQERLDRHAYLETTRDLKRSKYGNVKTEVNGLRFDSILEARTWGKLQLLEKAGEIHDLQRQVPYDLVVNGTKVCRYVADYRWLDKNGMPHVGDAKGHITKDFRLKAKLFFALNGFEIEIMR